MATQASARTVSQSEMVRCAIQDGAWVSVADVVGRTGLHQKTVRKHLHRLVDSGVLAIDNASKKSGVTHQAFKAIREGEIVPLFPRAPHSGTALASCWGGYTYVNQGA